MKITIGNDFRISWSLSQLGEAFTLEGKTYELVVRSSYGVIDVANVIASGNTLTFTVPASSQIYTGNYDVILSIDYGDNHYRLCQRDAFELVTCGGEIAGVVQLNSGIVYPRNGLSAYELAVLDGYTGSYDEWVATYSSIVSLPITINYADGTLEVYNFAHIVPRSDEYGSYAYDSVGTWDAGDTTEGEEETNNADTVETNEDDTTT